MFRAKAFHKTLKMPLLFMFTAKAHVSSPISLKLWSFDGGLGVFVGDIKSNGINEQVT